MAQMQVAVASVGVVRLWLLAGIETRRLGPFLLGKQGKTLPLCKQVTAMTAAILKNIKEQQQNPIEGSCNFLKIPKLYKNSKIKKLVKLKNCKNI